MHKTIALAGLAGDPIGIPRVCLMILSPIMKKIWSNPITSNMSSVVTENPFTPRFFSLLHIGESCFEEGTNISLWLIEINFQFIDHPFQTLFAFRMLDICVHVFYITQVYFCPGGKCTLLIMFA